MECPPHPLCPPIPATSNSLDLFDDFASIFPAFFATGYVENGSTYERRRGGLRGETCEIDDAAEIKDGGRIGITRISI